MLLCIVKHRNGVAMGTNQRCYMYTWMLATNNTPPVSNKPPQPMCANGAALKVWFVLWLPGLTPTSGNAGP